MCVCSLARAREPRGGGAAVLNEALYVICVYNSVIRVKNQSSVSRAVCYVVYRSYIAIFYVVVREVPWGGYNIDMSCVVCV